MKSLHILIFVILVASSIMALQSVFAQKTGVTALVFLRPDKEIYFPGDSVFIHGQDNMNVTRITIGLEKNHKVIVQSEDSQVLQNGTFYANFTLPEDSDAKYWSLVSGPLHQDLYFKSVYVSPLEQFREGIESYKTRCEGNLVLVISHDNLPACVKPDTAQKLVKRGWTMPAKISPIKVTHADMIVVEDAVTTIGNQTFYYKTLNDSIVTYNGTAAIQIKFHGMDFTIFPGVFSGGPPGSCGVTSIGSEVKFSDGTYEPLRVQIPGSPCVENYTQTVLSHHTHLQAGIQVYQGRVRLLVSTEGHSAFTLLPTLCDTPYNPKGNVITPLLPNGTHTITEYTPIFYMPINSTGKICVQYSNGNQPTHVGIRVFEADNLGKDSDTVMTSASQDIIPTGNSTVVYTINSGSKAGFYGVSLFCGGQGLAVGYDNNSRIVLGDFPWYGQAFSCPALTYNFKITGLSNIGIYYITKTSREQIGYNITGISVSSVHPTSTSQNVIFSFNVRTYSSGAHLWFDYKDSTLSKYFGDPGLKEESNPCTWDITNPISLDNAQEFQFIGNTVVNDNPVTIPPYSNGTYTFSVLAKGLGPGTYRLNPVIFSESTDSDIPQDRLGGAAVAQNYPLTIGLDSNMDPSGICRW